MLSSHVHDTIRSTGFSQSWRERTAPLSSRLLVYLAAVARSERARNNHGPRIDRRRQRYWNVPLLSRRRNGDWPPWPLAPNNTLVAPLLAAVSCRHTRRLSVMHVKRRLPRNAAVPTDGLLASRSYSVRSRNGPLVPERRGGRHLFAPPDGVTHASEAPPTTMKTDSVVLLSSSYPWKA